MSVIWAAIASKLRPNRFRRKTSASTQRARMVRALRSLEERTFRMVPSELRAAIAGFFHLGFSTGERFPPRHRHIHEPGLYLHRIAAPVKLLGRDDLRPAATEGFIAKVAGLRMHLDRYRKQPVRLSRWVILTLDLGVRDFPHRARIAVLRWASDCGFVAGNPSKQAWLVSPHKHRIGQDGPAFGPDDLLVDKSTHFLPDTLKHRLAFTGVPAVPCGAGVDRALNCSAVKRKIKRPPVVSTPVFVFESSGSNL